MPVSRRSRLRTVLVAVLAAATVNCGARAANTRIQVADAQTGVRVKTALVNDPVIGTLPIEVRVTGRVVTLHGIVRSTEEVDRALALARGVEGVARVDSALQIGDPDPPRESRDTPALPALAPRREGAPFRLLGVGGALGLVRPSDDTLASSAGARLQVRLRPRRGFGPLVGFSWNRTELGGGDAPSPLAALRLRPVMAGVEYGVVRGRLAAGASVVAGYAFNSLDVDTTRAGPGRAIAVGNSFAWRPSVSVWYEVAPRLGLTVSVGRLFTRPEVTFANDTSVDTRRLNADATIIGIGAAYWIF